MRLIVGLGNPGSQYAKNRHNIGFMLLDALAEDARASTWSSKHQGQLCEALIAGQKRVLLKPQTFMNLSGQSVAAVARFYKIAPEEILVVHDELDIPFGTLKVKQGGGHGGHNGLKSIDAHCGQNYWRLRLGIGHPGDKERVTGHVLGNFAASEQPELAHLLGTVCAQLPLLLQGDAPGFTNRCKQPA